MEKDTTVSIRKKDTFFLLNRDRRTRIDNWSTLPWSLTEVSVCLRYYWETYVCSTFHWTLIIGTSDFRRPCMCISFYHYLCFFKFTVITVVVQLPISYLTESSTLCFNKEKHRLESIYPLHETSRTKIEKG